MSDVATSEHDPLTERFGRQARLHMKTLQRRLDHLRVDQPSRRGDAAYPPGEASALAWVLSTLESAVDPIELRVERLDHALRKVQSRLGRVEHLLDDEVE